MTADERLEFLRLGGPVEVWAAGEIERLHNIIGHATALMDTKHISEARDVLRLADTRG